MDRTQLLIEADKRGLLNPEQKAELDASLQAGAATEPGPVQQAGQYLTQTVPRAAGIAARTVGPYAAGTAIGAGIGSVIPGVGTLIGGGAGFAAAGATQLVDQLAGTDYTGKFMDKLGLPRAQSPGERLATEVGGSVGAQGAMTTGGRLMAQQAGPVVKRIGEQLAANPSVQAAGAAGSGAAGGVVKEGGGGPIDQFVASVAGGLGTAGLTQGAKLLYGKIAEKVGTLFRPNQDIAQINITLNQMLQENGIDVSQVPAQLRQQLVAEVRKATATGGQLNPEVVRRIADYAVVGMTPTLGRVTRNPAQVTQEKNLAKIGSNSPDERLQTLGNIEDQNNARMIEFLNVRGGGTTNANPVVAGTAAERVPQQRDARMAAIEKKLYERAEAKAGRQIELDSQGFVTEAYNNLVKSGKGAFLPAEVKQILAQLWKGTITGPDGVEVAVPWTVNDMNNLKTILATASRGNKDGNAKMAISDVYDAINTVQPRAAGRAPTGGTQVVDPAQMGAAQTQADTLSAEAMAAFDKARRFARGRRQWQESTPGIEAALNDPNPDNFIQNFILGGGKKAQTAEVERLMHTIRTDPEATQAVTEHIVNWLKQSAIGKGTSDEVGKFSQKGYNDALAQIGDLKLRLFFTPSQIAELKTLGRAAAYEMVDPKGSAVNYSNSGALVAARFSALLDKVAKSPVVRAVPFAEPAITTPAQNWANRLQANQALNVGPGAQQAPLRLPQAVEPSIVEKLFGPSALLIAKQPRNDDKDR